MIIGIITILLGILPFIMFTQPLFWAYTGEGKDIFNAIYKNVSVYNGLTFQEGQNIYVTVGNIFVIATMVFAGIMILLTLLNLIGRASGNKKYLVGAKFAAFLFFVSVLVATIMFAVYMAQTTSSGVENILQSTVGYGLVISVVGAFLALFFAPRKKLKKE